MILLLCETRCDNVDMGNVKDKFRDIGFDLVRKNKSVLSRYKSRGLAITIRQYRFEVEIYNDLI